MSSYPSLPDDLAAYLASLDPTVVPTPDPDPIHLDNITELERERAELIREYEGRYLSVQRYTEPHQSTPSQPYELTFSQSQDDDDPDLDTQSLPDAESMPTLERATQ